VAHD
jgi:putative alpha-1,2-mannosidase